MIFPIVWQTMLTALTGVILGVFYQAMFIAQFSLVNLCCNLSIGLVALFAKPKQLNLKLFCCFFALASISVQLHFLQNDLKINFLKQQPYVKAIISQKQPLDDNFSNLAADILNLGLFNIKAIIYKAAIKAEVGDLILIKPPFCNFFPQKTNNYWLLRDQKILTFQPKTIWSLKLLKNAPSMQRKILSFKEHFQARVAQFFTTPVKELFVSIFLGKKVLNCDAPAREWFCVWGLSHFLARSGLHVTIFISLIWWLFGWIPIISVSIRSWLSLILLLIYSLLSWSSISFVRASSTLTLVLLARILKLKYNTSYLLCLIALFVILNNPFELLCVDFQLSFSLAFALILACKHLNHNFMVTHAKTKF